MSGTGTGHQPRPQPGVRGGVEGEGGVTSAQRDLPLKGSSWASAEALVKQLARRQAAQRVQSGAEVECTGGGSGRGRGPFLGDLPRLWRIRFYSGPMTRVSPAGNKGRGLLAWMDTQAEVGLRNCAISVEGHHTARYPTMVVQ